MRCLRFARQPNLQGTGCSLPRRAKKPALSPRHPAKSGNHAGGAARATLEIWLPRLKFFFLAECKQRSEFLQIRRETGKNLILTLIRKVAEDRPCGFI